LKDLRAALRHGEAVMVRRVHPSVISVLAAAVASMHSAIVTPSNANMTPAWQRVEHRALLARDAGRLSAAVLGIAGAVFITGEVITTPALAMLALLPTVVILAKSGECSAMLQALRGDARRAEQLRHKVLARRNWLTAVSRSARLLERSLGVPHALYATPKFGESARVMRRMNATVSQTDRLHDALLRARNVEGIITDSPSRRDVDLAHVVTSGWSSPVFFWRRVLFAGALAAFCNTVLLAAAMRPAAAVIAGLACSTILGVRYFLSSWDVRRIDFAIRRQSMRMRYPDMMREVDQTIQDEIDRLVALYANGLDVHINPFEDLEPQLRRQIDAAVAVSAQSERELQEVLDLRSLRDTFRPSAN
jgi:hypothetical protein